MNFRCCGGKADVREAEGVERQSLDADSGAIAEFGLRCRRDSVVRRRGRDACERIVVGDEQLRLTGSVREGQLMHSHVSQARTADVPRQPRLRLEGVYRSSVLRDPVGVYPAVRTNIDRVSAARNQPGNQVGRRVESEQSPHVPLPADPNRQRRWDAIQEAAPNAHDGNATAPLGSPTL